jgi:outer membrane protein insertion porin family
MRLTTKLAVICFLGSSTAGFTQDDAASEGAKGYLVLNAGYSDRYKETIGVEFAVENAFKKNVDLRFGASKNSLGHQWNVDVHKSKPITTGSFANRSSLRMGLSGQDYSWDNALFQSERLGAFVGYQMGFTPLSTMDVRAEVYRDIISNVSSSASPLVAADAGEVNSSGLSLTFQNKAEDGSRTVFLRVEKFGLTGDANWSSVSAGYKKKFTIGNSLTARFSTEAGSARGYGSYDLRLTDRAFLSNDQLRGFSFGGVGPMDSNGTSVTSLGGQKFVAASFEIEKEVHQFSKGTLAVSYFFDMGSVWDLPNTTGGFIDPVDDSFFMRQSVGAALNVKSQIGKISISYATPMRKRSTDRTQEFALNMSVGF